MKLEILYTCGEIVKIPALEVEAYIEVIQIEFSQFPTYKVSYWMNGERKYAWLPCQELKKLNDKVSSEASQ